jgi:protein-tyrosine phosphatase/arsenate reductase
MRSFLLAPLLALHAAPVLAAPVLSEPLAAFVKARQDEFDTIPSARREQLERLAQFVSGRVKAGLETRLTFICTHNSRRSHLGQIWAQTAAHVYDVPRVTTYSGGTEVSAFNGRAVAALERAGFTVEAEGAGTNPVYRVQRAPGAEVARAFSKRFADPPNPTADFAAVMTCTAADKSCPIVSGAVFRVAIPYVDPKEADGTAAEAASYDERNRQIARELLYVFSRVSR